MPEVAGWIGSLQQNVFILLVICVICYTLFKVIDRALDHREEMESMRHRTTPPVVDETAAN